MHDHDTGDLKTASITLNNLCLGGVYFRESFKMFFYFRAIQLPCDKCNMTISNDYRSTAMANPNKTVAKKSNRISHA